MPEHNDALDFERIYEKYADDVLDLAWRMTGDEEVARDLTQDIFVKVLRGLDSFEGRSGVYTWIYRIAVNHVTNHLRRERRHQWISLLDQTVGEAVRGGASHGGQAGPSAPDARADATLEQAERAQIVWRAVRELPPKYRVPIVLYHYREMSYKEIAGATGLSMSAVESRIHRGRKKLIKLLEPWVERI